jgi:hypothetical protein
MNATQKRVAGRRENTRRSAPIVRAHKVAQMAAKPKASGRSQRRSKPSRPATSCPSGERGGGPVKLNKQTNERIGTMSDKAKVPGAEVFDQALKNYEQTLRNGLKLQEEAGRWWSSLLNQASSVSDLQKRVTALTNEVVAPTQKRMEEYLGLIEENNKTNVELLKEALDLAQTTAPAEYQAKLLDFCEASMKAVQANAQSVTQIQGRMIDSWVSFIKKNAFELPEPVTSKA